MKTFKLNNFQGPNKYESAQYGETGYLMPEDIRAALAALKKEYQAKYLEIKSALSGGAKFSLQGPNYGELATQQLTELGYRYRNELEIETPSGKSWIENDTLYVQ